MSEVVDCNCMQLPIEGDFYFYGFKKLSSVTKLFSYICFYCGCELLFPMSAVPQGAFLTAKIRQNNEKKKPKDQGNFYEMKYNMQSNPLQYNSKMMNSIWGLYNRYSVHNLKKNIDKNVQLNTVNQQLQTVGSTVAGTNTGPVFTSAWDKWQSAFGGNTY